ncbi:serine/threonine protein kinase [Massilia sp. DWR3-1-1]|uniref:serine/threonine protein kinase n=1 Tax=Massilia sp. DWR3-1-1 TaxID=2804559 RepID=UPI003CEE2751
MSEGVPAPATPEGMENCLPPGTRLADYEIVRVLGEGGFGIVYLAFDHSLHRNVAIKEYMPSALAVRGNDQGVSLRAERHQETFRIGLKSFISEARFLASFDHPALVKVHRYWEQNRTAYTAMQYYDGRTVKQLVAHEPELVDQAWCLRLLGDILQALEMLYTMRIVHRDVSPDNIIIQPGGDAVLLDFGSARQVIGDMTKGLTVILKPGYAPVEQYAGDAALEQGAYTDIYALAAVIHFAITGKAPASSIARMIQDPLVPLRAQAPPGYSGEFLSAIDTGMAVLAHDRPQTLDAFRALLGIAVGAPLQGNAWTEPVRAPAAASAASALASNWPVEGVTIRMPVSGVAEVAEVVPAAAPPSAARRLGLLAAAVLIVLAGGYLLAALLRDGGEDTIMLAHPQPQPRAVAPAARPALAPPLDMAAVSAPAPAADTMAEPLPATAPAADAAADGAQADMVHTQALESSTVTLAVKPWGTVFVDGRRQGDSPPLKRLTLPLGTHQVRIVNPGFADHAITIDVGKSQGKVIAHEFRAAPSIDP